MPGFVDNFEYRGKWKEDIYSNPVNILIYFLPSFSPPNT